MSKGKFQSLQEKIWKRIIMWGENFLSSGGKEIMLKAVIQAIPVYVMGLFKLPDSVCEDLNKISRSFWWGADRGKRKTYWRSWDQLVKPKQNGGLGFRDFRLFNQALLARQAWRLIDRPKSLCARVLRAKYYPSGSLIDTAFGGNASPGWRAIEYGLELLKKGIIWRVGNGHSIRIWRDPWLPRNHSRRPITVRGNCRTKWVADLMGVDGTWDEQVVKRIFWPMDAELILTIRLSARAEEDFLAWHPDKWGVFSVRSAYKLALQLAAIDNGLGSSEAETSKAWNLVWKCNVPQKVKVFTWRAATNSLATMENKNKRKLEATGTCGICGVEAEDVAHALCRCPQAKKMWDAMQVAGKGAKDIVGNCTRADWILYQLKIMPREQHAMFLMVLWRIWYVRN